MPVNTNWGPGPVNTNLGPGPVNTNWGSEPGPGAGKYKYPKTRNASFFNNRAKTKEKLYARLRSQFEIIKY